MTVSALIANPYRDYSVHGQLLNLRTIGIIRSRKFKDGVKEGMEDTHTGQVFSWNEVRQELGLGED